VGVDEQRERGEAGRAEDAGRREQAPSAPSGRAGQGEQQGDAQKRPGGGLEQVDGGPADGVVARDGGEGPLDTTGVVRVQPMDVPSSSGAATVRTARGREPPPAGGVVGAVSGVRSVRARGEVVVMVTADSWVASGAGCAAS
jgi:hypothetical protein